ncbi:DNA-binding transcriptional regulator, LysR family [Geodermatophilus sp. DSM 45219]|nr:DNA-binding transcriptional regulator, LysR family [Geodermatophilus sp. DSM 45219]
MIDVRRLRVLRELADHGTIVAAAGALHLTPSAVSQQLTALARETGVALLEPDGRRLRLTDAAHVLLQHAHVVFAQLEQAEADLARHAAGHRSSLRIGAFPTALAQLVAPVVAALRHADELLSVQAVETDEPACFAQLAGGELDIVVSVETSGAPQQDDPRLHRTPLLADVLDAVLPADHRYAGATAVALEDLAADAWILALPGSSCEEITRVACATAGFTPRSTHSTNDWTATGALLAAAGAVTLVPRLAQPLLPAGLVVVPLAGASPTRHLFAATRRGASTAPVTARALNLLAETAASLRRIASTCG